MYIQKDFQKTFMKLANADSKKAIALLKEHALSSKST